MVLFYALGYSVRCLEEGCEAVDGGTGTFGLRILLEKFVRRGDFGLHQRYQSLMA
jgi:hypothetical protein